MTNWYRLLMAMLLLLTFPTVALVQQQEGQDLQALQSEIKQTESLIKQQQAQLNKFQKALKESEYAVSKIAKALHATEQKQADESRNRDLLKAKKESIEQQLNRQKTALAKQIRLSHSNGQLDMLKVVFNQQDPATFQRNLNYFKYLSDAHIRKIEKFKQLIEELETVKVTLNRTILQLAQLATSQQQHQQQLFEQQAERQINIKKLDSVVQSERTRLSQLRQSEQALQEQIEQAQQRLQSAMNLDGLDGLKGKLTAPAKGRIRKLFGIKREGLVQWNGIKIEGKHGGAITSIYQGKVLFSDWIKGFGLVMVVDHGKGYMSLYGHNQALLKQAGEQVLAGETIALLGNSGGQKKSALYFEIRDKGRPVNPSHWLKK